jgi:hypothetical protein
VVSRRSLIIGASVAGVFVLGYAAHPNNSEVVKTETKTIRIKVKEPGIPTTVTETKEVLSDSCRKALDETLSLVSYAVKMSNPDPALDQLKAAYVAIYNKDFRAINQSLEEISTTRGKIIESRADYEKYYPQFRTDLAECKEETK